MTEERILKYSESLNEGLAQAMESDPDIFVMGCGVDDEGGIFGTTRAAFEKFGRGRVMDVPLAENAIAGIGVGAALLGKRPVVVHARNDFLFLAMDQIINHAAKWNFMSGKKLHCPLVVRAIVGRGWGQAAQHSQSLQATFSHFPGIKVVLPASAYDAKGLLMASFKQNDPVLLIEHRLLYGHAEPVPIQPYTVELGKGDIKKTGRDLTIVAFSYMVKEALDAAEILQEMGIEIEVVDPRCSAPLDFDLILQSVRKTKRVLIADTSWTNYGISAEICSRIAEKAFNDLKTFPKRIGLPSYPTPCSAPLEKAFYPGVQEIVECALDMIGVSQKKNVPASKDHSKFKGPF
jgi:acetoin:2,6-dichlorophenolindophenol oxidoreductase subunit beta